MRAIDGDALKRRAQKVATEAWKMKIEAKVETILNQFIDWINEAPTIQPEIVRCEECLYRKICSWEKQGAKFCSFAEKREVTT